MHFALRVLKQLLLQKFLILTSEHAKRYTCHRTVNPKLLEKQWGLLSVKNLEGPIFSGLLSCKAVRYVLTPALQFHSNGGVLLCKASLLLPLYLFTWYLRSRMTDSGKLNCSIYRKIFHLLPLYLVLRYNTYAKECRVQFTVYLQDSALIWFGIIFGMLAVFCRKLFLTSFQKAGVQHIGSCFGDCSKPLQFLQEKGNPWLEG